MSRDVLTVGSTMRILLLYRGEYSQWSERFMKYLEEQTDGEAMINSIKNSDQPLPRVTQASIAGTSSTEQPHLKDKSMWSDQEKKIQKIDHSEGSEANDFSELKKITALLAKAFNGKKFYSKPTNNNLRTSSASQFANKKQEYVKSDDKKVEKKDDEKNDSDQEINANMVFMAQIEKVLSDSEASSSFVDDKISEVSYYLSEFESESEYETSEYYYNTTTYGLFVNDNDDQEIFHDYENFPENLIESQIDHNESAVDHNDSEGIDKLIRKFNKKIAKCLKCIEKANQQNKDFKNQNKDLQDKYDVLKNQATTFEMKNKELNEQLKVLIKKMMICLFKRMC
nr:hypothetical protein [Tanacetum cinerariifolium]